MTAFLLDTDTCIDFLRGSSPEALKRLSKLTHGEVAISAITYAELRYGADHSSQPGRNHEALGRLVASLAVLPFNAAAAETYGSIRATLARAGNPIGPLDMLIAAHAVTLGMTLVTRNTREFHRIPSLRMERWGSA